MTMNIRKIALAAGLLLSVLTTSAQGQSSAYQPGVTQDGVSYFLPKTMVTVTVTAQKQTFKPGEFSRYAERYLRLSDVKDKAEEVWSIKDIKIPTVGVPDRDNLYTLTFPAKGNLTLACKGLPEGIFKLLLTHDPYHWRHRVLPETDIALTLAGHTHGGQLRLFGWSPIKLVHKEWGGTYTEPGGAVLHISTGLGQALVAFRLGRWPQIDVLTLKTPAP